MRIFLALLPLLISCSPALAAVTGTVINRSTGKPQPGATVALYKLGAQTGLEMIDQAKSDAQGNFTINQTPQGPHLIRTAFDGVTYNHMLPPGRPTAGITIDVYNASKLPGSAKVGKHMILFEPAAGQMGVSETFLFTNQGTTAWNDPAEGTLRFYMPPGANGKAQVNATAPGGMPIGAPINKTAKPGVYAVDFPVKPGDTRFDVTYTVPYMEGAPYQGKVITKDENTYLIVPSGVTLKGDHLNDLGQEPRTQAHIFGLTGSEYNVQLTGAVAAAPAEAADSESGPRIEQIMPRVNGQARLIIALALGILAVGFALLYRAAPGAPSPKETNERGRG